MNNCAWQIHNYPINFTHTFFFYFVISLETFICSFNPFTCIFELPDENDSFTQHIKTNYIMTFILIYDIFDCNDFYWVYVARYASYYSGLYTLFSNFLHMNCFWYDYLLLNFTFTVAVVEWIWVKLSFLLDFQMVVSLLLQKSCVM